MGGGFDYFLTNTSQKSKNVFVYCVKCVFFEILELTCFLPPLVSSSWVDTSLINSCKDKTFGHFPASFSNSAVSWREARRCRYIPPTQLVWTCQSINQHTAQSSRVLSAAATTSPFSSLQVINHHPGECACSRCPCFDTGCTSVARAEEEGTALGVELMPLTATTNSCYYDYKCPSRNLATVVLHDVQRCSVSRVCPALTTPQCWHSAWWLRCQHSIITLHCVVGFGWALCTHAF